MDLNAYRAFVLAVERGTITEAAAELGVSRPTLSRQLASLEEQLGLALLHRTTRQVRVTPRGRRLYEQVRPLLDGMDSIETRLHEERTEPVGWLRVSVPPIIATDILRTFAVLQQAHPRLAIELLAETQWADLHSDRVDVAVRAGRIGDASFVRRRLGARDVYAAASPQYLERRGVPRSVEDLQSHDLLRAHDPHGEAVTSWPTWSGSRIAVGGRFVSNDHAVLQEAALGGRGIALLSDVTAGQNVDSGRLVRVLPEHIGAELVLYAVFARRTLQPAAVRACVDALVDWAESGGPHRLRGA